MLLPKQYGTVSDQYEPGRHSSTVEALLCVKPSLHSSDTIVPMSRDVVLAMIFLRINGGHVPRKEVKYFEYYMKCVTCI